jgi:diguanylate cyclase (GGDEF)-like protein
MIQTVIQLATHHSYGFVITALVICVVAGWLVAKLLRNIAEAKHGQRWRWLVGTAVVGGLGVWTTHFIAMLGYRPDMMLGYEGGTTALSAIVAVVVVGVPLAITPLFATWRLRAGLGALAGAGIGAMHYTGMVAIEGCLQIYSPLLSGLAISIGACCLALACGLPRQLATSPMVCSLFTLAVGGTHFIAIAGTSVERITGQGSLSHENVTLSVFTAVGAAVLFIGAFMTILTAQRFEAQERAHSAVLTTALNNMSNGLIFLDADRRLGLFNKRFLELCKLDPRGLRPGMDRQELLETLGHANGWDAERRRMIGERIDHWSAMADGEISEHATVDGRLLEVTCRCIEAGGSVLTIDDVTQEREAQQRIAELAFCDPLTKLANRRALQARMERDFYPKQRFKLLLIDLDRFKPVNDTYGHGVGDLLLVQVAERVSQIVGPNGFVARLGGDEMAILVYGDFEQATGLAERVLEAIAFPFQIGEITINIGCSIGMCCTDDACDATELMQFSDIALYESKRHGRGRVSCYSRGMMEAVSERLQLETDMHTAIERGEMHLAYQPVLALADDRVIGYEALIRWDHPTLGTIPPVRFIPLAEETGQIVPIGAWVLREACHQIAQLPGDVYVAVNVSPVQFRSPLLLSHLTQALSYSGLPAQRLEIELTETAIVEDGSQIATTLTTIRRLGVTVAMDDFGTGYSSLAHLRDFPVDRIKVDRSFVATAETDRHSMAVLEGITHIARKLDIAILAEGVETTSQLQMLRHMGCDAIQGYLIGRPERFADSETHLRPLVA